MTDNEQPPPFRKSSFSTNNGTCVEVSAAGGVPVARIRNSVHPDRGMVTLDAAALAAFVGDCRSGAFDDLT